MQIMEEKLRSLENKQVEEKNELLDMVSNLVINQNQHSSTNPNNSNQRNRNKYISVDNHKESKPKIIMKENSFIEADEEEEENNK